MQRFVSKRSSSSVDLASFSASSSLDDVRAEAGRHRPVCWSELATRQACEIARSAQPASGNVLSISTSSHLHELPHGVCLQRPGRWRSGDTIARPLTHEEIAHTLALLVPLPPQWPTRPPQPLHSFKTSPAAARQNAVKSRLRPHRARLVHRHVAPVEGGAAMGDAAVLVCKVRRSCPGMFDGVNGNTPHRWKRSARRAAASLGRRDFAVTRRHDTVQRAHRARVRRPVPQSGAWCPVGSTQRDSTSVLARLVGQAVPVCGMHLSNKKPAKCVKELHSPEQQHANTHRLFIKLCWLMDHSTLSAQTAS